MSDEHRSLLVKSYNLRSTTTTLTNGLTLLNAVICLVDLFGILPTIVLPRALISCGFYGAILLTCCVVGTQIFTAVLLSKSWRMAKVLFGDLMGPNRCPYRTLAVITYGRSWAKFVTLLLDLSIFGSGIPNLIIASQSLQFFFNAVTDSNISFCYWMIIMGVFLCPILWFGSPKDMKLICTTSVINILTIVLIENFTILRDTRPPTTPIISTDKKTYLQTLISTYGLMIFQFDIHPVLLTIQVDMKDDSKSIRVIVLGFLTTLLMVTLTTLSAANKYGSNTFENVLENLPAGLSLNVILLLVTLQLSFSSALCQNAFFQHIEDYFNISRDFNHKRCLIRSSLVVLSILIAETVPRFDMIMQLIGGTLTGPLIFLFPPLIYLRLIRMSRCQGLKINLFTLVLIALCLFFGAMLTLISTFYNFANAIDFVKFQTPCLLNITRNLFLI